MNILVTSRFIPEIVENFKDNVLLELRASSEDVDRYLESHMRQLPSFVHQERHLQEEIRVGISQTVDGMCIS